MKLKMRGFFLLLFIGNVLVFVGCSTKKGFEALDVYNYFEAKKQFEKSLKRNESPAAYGLGTIYFRNDNPFHNKDSAFYYSLLAVKSFSYVKPKKREKWLLKLGYGFRKAEELRQQVGKDAFQQAVETNTVLAFDQFLVDYSWSYLVRNALRKRDSLAFELVKENPTSVQASNYIKKYPESRWKDEAKSLLTQAQFKETIRSDDSESYVEFLHRFPSSPLREEAERKIYEIKTKGNSIKEFERFILEFPNNPHLNEAWEKLYRLSISDYTKESIERFSTKHPTFPFPEWIARDLEAVSEKLYLFQKNERFGYMNEQGEPRIAPIFDYASPFSDGLAVVSVNDLLGYINREGNIVIPPIYMEAYEFNQGRAVVSKGDKYGVIDVTGYFVFSPVYDDIGNFEEGIAFVEKEGKYQYYTLEGTLAFSGMYDEAFSFEQGMAKVKQGNKWGYVLTDGKYIIQVEAIDIRPFSDSLFVVEGRNGMNLLKARANFFEYDEDFDLIGVLSEGLAIVEKDGMYGYIDEKGNEIIPIKYTPFPNYVEFAKFKNNHTIFQSRNKFGMINDQQKKILPAVFDGIGEYGELIPVSKGKGWGYANDRGQIKIKYEFEYAYPFRNGLAIVYDGNHYGAIDSKGDFVIPIEFSSLRELEDFGYLVEDYDLFGIFDTKGEVILPIIYNKITLVDKSIYKLENAEGISYYDTETQKLITLDDKGK